MGKKIAVFSALILGLIIVFLLISVRNQSKNSISNLPAQARIQPSETLIEYVDPSGFTFSYPDNLSLTKNETADEGTYADILLSANGVNGSLNLKIVDSEFKSIEEWVKGTPTEKKLGNLKALEVRLKDRLLLGSLDQGVLFTIEMPLLEEDFWMKVYDKVLANFSFAPPAEAATGSSADISFEGEEVVE